MFKLKAIFSATFSRSNEIVALSITTQQSINNLKTSYSKISSSLLSWLFFPKEIKKALTEYPSGSVTNNQVVVDNARKLCSAALKHTWFFQRWFFPCLQAFFESNLMKGYHKLHTSQSLEGDDETIRFNHIASNERPLDCAEALALLSRSNLVIDAALIKNAVSTYPTPLSLAKLLIRLNSHKLLTETILYAIETNLTSFAYEIDNWVNHISQFAPNLLNEASLLLVIRNPKALETFYTAFHRGLLTGDEGQNYLHAIATHINPRDMCDALTILVLDSQPHNMVNQLEFKAIMEHVNPIEVATGLRELAGDRQIYREAIVKNIQPCATAQSILVLKSSGLATPVNIDILATHPQPKQIYELLRQLEKAHLLLDAQGQAIFNAIVQHKSPDNVGRALQVLQEITLLTNDDIAEKVRHEVVTHPDPSCLVTALNLINDARLLNHETLNTLVTRPDLSDFTASLSLMNNSRILNQKTFNALVTHPALSCFLTALHSMNMAHLLNHKRFDALVTHTDILFDLQPQADSRRKIEYLWQQLYKLTSLQFDKIIDICQEHTTNPAKGRQCVYDYLSSQGYPIENKRLTVQFMSERKTKSSYTPPEQTLVTPTSDNNPGTSTSTRVMKA